MTLQIYGVARTRAFRALWIAEELKLAYEHVPVEIGDDGARKPEFLAINPNGRLPVIIDGNFVLSESLAITLYLAKKYSHGKLHPAAIEEEARVGQWSFWAVAEVDRGVNIWSLHAVRLPPEERNAALRDEALKLLAAPFAVLDTAVAWRPLHRGRSQCRRRHQPRCRHGSVGLAAPEKLADAMPRSAGSAQGAGAQGAVGPGHAGRCHPPHRPDQSAVSVRR
jgi:glutathione S-transferase